MVSTSRAMRSASQRVVVLLAAAVLLGAAHASADQLTASWVDNSGGVATTRIERRLSTDTTYAPLVDVPPGITTYVDTTVTTGSTYCYRAYAWDTNGTSPFSAEACATAGGTTGFSVSVSKTGSGVGTVTSSPAAISCGSACSATFASGTIVTLTGAAAAGSTFDGWTGGGCAGTAPCTIATNTGAAVTASFSVASYPLTVTTSGSGTVSSTPAGISCGSTCSASYRGGTQVTLTATPASGAVFAGWGGACSGTAGCSVTMNAAATVSATFRIPLSGQCTTPAGEVGVAYSASCSASGGTAPYSCSLGSGTLPAGLTLASSCSITGTPTTAGSGTFTVRVTDAVNNTLNINGSLTVMSAVGVTTTTLPSATVNQTFSTTLAAAGGKTPYSWAVTAGALPAGLTLNASTGAISGVATTTGTSTFTVQVRDALGATAGRSEQLTVNLGPLTASCALASGEVGVAYSGACTPKAGLAPYSCSLASGTPPAGVTVNSNCSISGTPTSAGTSSFSVRAADSGGAAVTTTTSLAIVAHAAVATTTLPSATLGAAYSTTLLATGGKTPYTWMLRSGALPAGLALNGTTGVITGTSTVVATSSFTVQVTDAFGATGQQALQLTVVVGQLSASCALPVGQVGLPYSGACAPKAGLPPYTCSLASGTPPVGVAVNTDCSVSGTPATMGTNTFMVRVNDSASSAVSTAASMTTMAHVGVTTATLPKAPVNKTYSTTLAASGGKAPYTWALTGGALPNGVALSTTTGVISGMPSSTGVSSFTVQVGDGMGATGQRTLQFVANLGPLAASCTLPAAEVGIPYSGACTPSLGLPPYSCSLGTGTAPAGLTVNSDCSITGTPTTGGTSTFTVRATDSGSSAVSATASIAVLGHVGVGTATLPKATVNAKYTTTLAATGGRSPYTWAVTAGMLPSGLSLNPNTGAISGIGDTLGVTNFTVQVTDAFGATGSRPLQLVVNLGPLAASCTLAAGEAGLPYSGSCTPKLGLPPYGCAFASGTLAAGLTVNNDCTITGTPANGGLSSFSVRVSDSGGSVIGTSATLSTLAHVGIGTAKLPKATVNTKYTATLAPTGGKSPYTWAITAGGLPSGFALDPATGAITGMSGTTGVSPFTVSVTDALGATADRTLSFVVNLGPLAMSCTLPAGEAGVPYSGGCTPRLGLPPYTCALAGGSLPAGLTVNSDCTITGTPTARGTGSFSVGVSDSGMSAVTTNVALTVLAHVGSATAALPTATINRAYSTTLAVLGGKSPYTWAVTGGALPVGLTMNPTTGAITGTPTALGVSTFTAQVTDGFGATGELTLQLTVNLGPLAASCALPAGEPGIPYSGHCTPSLGLPPYSCALASGTVPAGLAVNSDCSVSGTPTTAGIGSFTVKVTDAGGSAAAAPASLNVLAHTGITTTSLANAQVKRAYSATLAAAGGKAPYTWAITGGALPAGLSLNAATGAIAGLPTATAVSSFTVQVMDAFGATDQRTLGLSVVVPPLVASCATSGQVNSTYAGCAISGGVPQYTCAVTSGRLPTGVTMQSNCTTTGTATTAETVTYTVVITDSSGTSVTRTVTVSVTAGVKWRGIAMSDPLDLSALCEG